MARVELPEDGSIAHPAADCCLYPLTGAEGAPVGAGAYGALDLR
jgi:hypothetical protein